MSVITLQFGQCGNQIGTSLYREIYKDIKMDTNKTSISKKANMDYIAESVNKWFHVTSNGMWNARSILIDAENKVVSKTNNEFYKFCNLVAKSHGGSANNWAYGYCSKSNLLICDIQDAVRKEIEKGCNISSIVGILSSAGGTGSGVGSKTLELLRDEYPNKIISGIVVLPYTRGEIVTQNYNNILTLSRLYDIVDGMILYENDIMHRMCSKMLSLSNVTFDDINGIIAQQLTTTFQPVKRGAMWTFIKDLTAHPAFKVIQIRSAPHTSEKHLEYETSRSWSLIVNDIKTALRNSYDLKHYKTKSDKTFKCANNILICRGEMPITDECLKPFLEPTMYSTWLPVEYQLSKFFQKRNFKENKKFATFLSNNNNVYNTFGVLLDDALTLYANKAYLHHYEKYGINEQIFSVAFNEFSDILENYKNM